MRFRLYEILEVEIVEVLSEGNYILSIEGSLLRVQSQLDSRPRAGDRLTVKVIALAPLKFQTVRGPKMGLDLEI